MAQVQDSKMSKGRHVVIVGAGPVGCLLARLMARRGYRIDVYDSRPEIPLSEPSMGSRSINLSLSPRGMKALRHAGLEDAILNAAVPMRMRVLHDAAGRQATFAYGKEHWRTYSIERNRLNRILALAAAETGAVRFHYEQRCLHYDTSANTVLFADAAGMQKSVQADLVVAADGAYSAIRTALTRQPQFDYTQQWNANGYKELTFRPIEGEYAFEPGAIHIWARNGFFMIALPNTDRTFRGTLVMPLQGESSFASLDTPEKIEAFLSVQFPDAFPHLCGSMEEFLQKPIGNMVTVRCGSYHWRDSVVLMGDAAHAMTPFMGQGVNMGLEDCQIFEGLLERYQDDLSQALPAYTAVRRQDGEAAADLSLANFAELAGHEASRRTVLLKLLRNWLHRLSPRLVSPPPIVLVNFLNVSYAEAKEAGKRKGWVWPFHNPALALRRSHASASAAKR